MRKIGFATLVAVGCSTLIFGCGKSKDAADKLVKTENPQTCPSAAYPIYHRMNIRTTEPLPEKFSVNVDGVLKYDECLEQPVITPPAPAVFVRRRSGALEVIVQHLDAYPTFPIDVSFEVLDRKDCVVQAVTFFAAAQVPLTFRTEYPNGVKCGGNTFAKVDLDK